MADTRRARQTPAEYANSLQRWFRGLRRLGDRPGTRASLAAAAQISKSSE
jgi:hypothetical protein